MNVLPGSTTAIRAAARALAAYLVRVQAVEELVSELVGHSGDAGTFTGGRQLRAVLVARRTQLRDLRVKGESTRAALEDLATRLDALDEPSLLTAIPNLAGSSHAVQARWQAEKARSDAGASINQSLPQGTTGRMVEYPGLHTTAGNIWKHGVVEPVEGVLGLGRAIYDLSPLRALIDPQGATKSWSDLASATATLHSAVVLDRYPDGRTGAREAVKAALAEIPDALVDRDVLDSDPAAWFVIYGATVAGLLVGAGEAKIGSKLLITLRKGFVPVSDLTKVGAAAGIEGAALRGSTATSRALDAYPSIIARLERPVSRIEGIWVQQSPHDFSGRLKFEDVVLALTRLQSPSMQKLATGHDVADLSDLFLVAPGDGRIVSAKTVDPTFATYVDNPDQIGTNLVRDADKLRSWITPGQPGGTHTPFLRDPSFALPVDRGGLGAERGTVYFLDQNLLVRDLYLGIPSDGLSAAHAEALDRAIRTIEQANLDSGITVTVHLVEVPR